jgi:outer membrane usher protein
VEASAGSPRARGAADLQWQTQYGRYEAQVEQTGQERTGSLAAAGGAVLIGGRGFLTRPVESSYGLMRVGVPDVRGYVENQEVGSTDSHGDLFLASLQPRYANRVKIRASDIPMDYDVGKVEQLLGPPYKRGAVIQFDVRPIRAVMARIDVQRGEGVSVPPRSEVQVKDGDDTLLAPVTSDGRFFLERVSPGRHEVVLSWQDGMCRFTIDVPDRAGVLNLGSQRCAPEATALAQ